MNNAYKFVVDNKVIENFGIPASLIDDILIIIKNSKSNILLDFDCKSKNASSLLYYSISNLISFYKLNKQVKFVNNSNNPAIINIKPKTLFFSPTLKIEKLKLTDELINFIDNYEAVFGKLPFYTKENAILEKFGFLNNCILGLNGI